MRKLNPWALICMAAGVAFWTIFGAVVLGCAPLPNEKICTVKLALVCEGAGCEYVPKSTTCEDLLTSDGRRVPLTCEECITDSECEALCPQEE